MYIGGDKSSVLGKTDRRACCLQWTLVGSCLQSSSECKCDLSKSCFKFQRSCSLPALTS